MNYKELLESGEPIFRENTRFKHFKNPNIMICQIMRVYILCFIKISSFQLYLNREENDELTNGPCIRT